MTETQTEQQDPWAEARQIMVEEVASEVRLTQDYLGKPALDPRVMEALRRVPRHAFVPPESQGYAYQNRPLSIGQGQTISQPYIVAVMTDAAGLGRDSRVLEIGTGCGYQAAVLAELADSVDTVEVIRVLGEAAAERLRRLGYDRVRVHIANGAGGWPAAAPYDAILVTAAAFERVPQPLIDQLAPGGTLVIPVERRGSRLRLFGERNEQELLVLAKDAEGRLGERSLLPVTFVPLVDC